MQVNGDEQTSDVETLHVQIAQVKIGRPGQVLTAILGSCIGIGFLYPQKQIFGLAHCLLSKSSNKVGTVGGRYVDQAIWSLQHLMGVEDKERRRMQVILAGGANMSLPEDTDPKKLVGSTNATFAYETVRKARLRLLEDDLGGVVGRQVTIDCTTGEYTIAHIPRLGA